MTDCARRIARGPWREDTTLARCTFPIGPRNTWSNLSYGFSGVAVMHFDRDATGLVMGLALIALMLGSGAYHALKTPGANKLDLVGMYLVFGALPMHAAVPAHQLTPWAMGIMGIVLAVVAVYLVPRIPLDVQMGLLLIFTAWPSAIHGNATLVAISMGLFLVAYGCWHLDRSTKVLGLYGHALWHVLTAVAIAVMYLSQGVA